MNNFEEIKDIWQQQSTESIPSLPAVKKAIANFQRSKKRNIISYLIVSVLCICTTIWIMIDYHSSLWTTRIGEVLFLLTGLYLCYSKITNLQKINNQESWPTQKYLDYLKHEIGKPPISAVRNYIYILLCIGFLLYIYELLQDLPQILMIGYILLLLFLILMWFVYRPIMISRHHNKIRNLLENIDQLKNQINEKN